MSGNLSFIFDRPIISKIVKYINQSDNSSKRLLSLKHQYLVGSSLLIGWKYESWHKPLRNVIRCKCISIKKGGRRGHDRMVDGFTTTYAISDSVVSSNPFMARCIRYNINCNVKLFLTFTSLNLVLLWQLFYLLCSSIVINTVIMTAGTFETSWKREVWRFKIWFNPPFL